MNKYTLVSGILYEPPKENPLLLLLWTKMAKTSKGKHLCDHFMYLVCDIIYFYYIQKKMTMLNWTNILCFSLSRQGLNHWCRPHMHLYAVYHKCPSTCQTYVLDQWFPTRVPRHTGVAWGYVRGVAKCLIYCLFKCFTTYGDTNCYFLSGKGATKFCLIPKGCRYPKKVEKHCSRQI